MPARAPRGWPVERVARNRARGRSDPSSSASDRVPGRSENAVPLESGDRFPDVPRAPVKRTRLGEMSARSGLLREETEREGHHGLDAGRRGDDEGIALTTQPTVARSPWNPRHSQVHGRIALDLDAVEGLGDADGHVRSSSTLTSSAARTRAIWWRPRPALRDAVVSESASTGSIVSKISSIGRPSPRRSSRLTPRGRRGRASGPPRHARTPRGKARRRLCAERPAPLRRATTRVLSASDETQALAARAQTIHHEARVTPVPSTATRAPSPRVERPREARVPRSGNESSSP